MNGFRLGDVQLTPEQVQAAIAVTAGMLGALAILALARRAIKVFVLLAVLAGLAAIWWLSRDAGWWDSTADQVIGQLTDAVTSPLNQP